MPSATTRLLIAEADDPPTVGAGCSLSGGRWFSYYDRVSWTDPADIDIDHLVPLAEAWDSGAHRWSSGQRETYANDLADYRTLVALREFVAVKHRCSLTVDSAEKSAMRDVATGCSDVTIPVAEAW